MKSDCVEDLRIAIDICENHVSRAKFRMYKRYFLWFGRPNLCGPDYDSVGRIYVFLSMVRQAESMSS